MLLQLGDEQWSGNPDGKYHICTIRLDILIGFIHCIYRTDRSVCILVMVSNSEMLMYSSLPTKRSIIFG